jgi:hypothetical protein
MDINGNIYISGLPKSTCRTADLFKLCKVQISTNFKKITLKFVVLSIIALAIPGTILVVVREITCKKISTDHGKNICYFH